MKRSAACLLTLCLLTATAASLRAQDDAGALTLSGGTLTTANYMGGTIDRWLAPSDGGATLTLGSTTYTGGTVTINNGSTVYTGSLTSGNPGLGRSYTAYSYKASKILADPLRARVYIADAVGKQIVVVDTVTLQVVAKVATSAPPADMAISMDNGTLYVYCNSKAYSAASTTYTASTGSLYLNNAGTLSAASTVNAGIVYLNNAGTYSLTNSVPTTPLVLLNGNTTQIDAIELETLAWRGMLTVQGKVSGIATGVGGQLYLAVSKDQGSWEPTIQDFEVLDPATGQVLSSCPLGSLPSGSMFLDPEKGRVRASFTVGVLAVDVSGDKPVRLSTRAKTSSRTGPMVASHDGSSLYWSNGDYYPTTGIYTQPLACSPDNTRLYQVDMTTRTLQVLDARTYEKLQESTLPFPPYGYGAYGSPQVASMTTDNTGRYLFMSVVTPTTGIPTKLGGSLWPSNELNGTVYVLDTGVDTAPPEEVNFVNAEAAMPSVTAGRVGRAAFKLTRTVTSDITQPLTVAYSVRGTAVSGTDYIALRGEKTIPAGSASATILLTPSGDIGRTAKTVTLRVQPVAGYQAGGSPKATVTILPSH